MTSFNQEMEGAGFQGFFIANKQGEKYTYFCFQKMEHRD